MTTKMQHTPGPWTYQVAHNYKGFSIAPEGRLPTLAAVHNYPNQTEANAKLMAAAPSLVEALLDLLIAYQRGMPFGDIGERERTPEEKAARAVLAAAGVEECP